jgi:hypothetical protein
LMAAVRDGRRFQRSLPSSSTSVSIAAVGGSRSHGPCVYARRSDGVFVR